MNDKLDNLLRILFDETARLDEKDDAIIYLGSLKDIRAINPLLRIATDNKQDYLLKASAGEAIANIMIDLNTFQKDYLINLTDDAKSEAINLLLAKKPEWKKFLD